MKYRNPILIILLTMITFGIYGLFWYVLVKNEMNRKGAKIPTALLLIIPIINYYWLWKFCEGVDKVTRRKMSGPVAFLLIFLLGIIGGAIIQNSLNQVSDKMKKKPVSREVAG